MDARDMDLFVSCLSCTTEADFDGHTDFARLSAEERLLWLSQCARFAVGLAELARRDAAAPRDATAGCPKPDLV